MYNNRSSGGATSNASSQKYPQSTVVSSVRTNDTEGTGPPETIEEAFRRRPTVRDDATLRRVSGKVPWMAYTIAFVELCERFSYYGTSAVCK